MPSTMLVSLLSATTLLLGVGTAHARISGNRLSPDDLAEARLVAQTLAQHELAADKLAPHRFAANPEAVDELQTTPGRQAVLAFILGCALPEGTVLVVTDPQGAELEYFGELGLAKSWLQHPLNKVSKGWITACLLARTSGPNVTRDFSMRGTHKALALEPGEAATYQLEEGAFYGNYFDSDGELIACRGKDEASVSDRDCTEPDPVDPTHTRCGFIYAGDCGDFAPDPVCKKFSAAGFYKGCHAQPIIPRDHSTKFQQVITTYPSQ